MSKQPIIAEAKRLSAIKKSMITNILLDADSEDEQEEALRQLHDQIIDRKDSMLEKTSERFVRLIIEYFS